MLKQRDIGIDILKFFAVLLITNSHMELLYGKYSMLATGGAIGDVLFFFCSGYTLFLGRERRFDNYYKRRINRIYPTVFMWALLSAAMFHRHFDMVNIVIHGGGWFVTCIMIYYVILHFIRKFAIDHLLMVLGVTLLVSLGWYLVIDIPDDFNMYGATYFKWCHYFSFMLLGAILGVRKSVDKVSLWKDSSLMLGCVVVFYSILFMGRKIPLIHDLQVVSLIPLMGVTYYFYKMCNSEQLKTLYQSKWIGPVMKTISGLCLEVYLVQSVLFTDRYNNLFPFNLFIMFVVILIVAYILRCLARWFSQTFKEGDYEWKAIFKLY